MKQVPKTTRQADGFTIAELLIATAIFSLVLLGALAGFLRTGNLFYKGVSLTQTQATAKQIVDDVSGNIASSSGANSKTSGGYNYSCVGNTRYTYAYNKPYVSTNNDFSSNGSFGLVKNTVSGCPAPCNGGGCTSPLSSGTEMLGDNMRISEFTVCGVGGSTTIYTINVIVAYGDDAALKPSSVGMPTCATGPLTAEQQPACTGTTENQQFCAVSVLSTSVYAGVSST